VKLGSSLIYPSPSLLQFFPISYQIKKHGEQVSSQYFYGTKKLGLGCSSLLFPHKENIMKLGFVIG
jgi:hypothetical protein